MSCVAAIQPRLTRAQIRAAQKQKFRYSSPAPRPSLFARLNVLAHETHPKLRESAAAAYNLPEHLQEHLAGDRDAGVRCVLARNPHVGWEVLRLLAADDNEAVRGFAVLNQNAPQDVVDLLAQDESELVRRLAAWVDSHRR